MPNSQREIEKTLFDGALNLPDPDVREAFLTQSCQGNPILRARLEKLLAAQPRAESFFDVNLLQATDGEAFLDVAPEPPAEMGDEPEIDSGPLDGANVRIGRYKLLRRLGEGGCGVVYAAEQQEPVRREVALKIIRLGLDTKRVITRFELERRALALMAHPNIAHVLDAGATKTGRPYFVMELVVGTKITDYCDEHRLGTEERLDLFIQVCFAVQHAHQKGILHRDIKPSNILITLQDGMPVPKVIDFGVAKAIEGPLADGVTFTVSDHFIGTPAYMSPEQAATGGADVDTRSDIYSLGALLYELLAGRAPFDAKELMELGLDEMRRAVQEREPPAPSSLLLSLPPEDLASVASKRGTDAHALIGSLKGDLDWIVMKAMEKDRQRRYHTATGLAADVRRYLENEPVTARPPSQIYRFRKLVRRNRMAFVAGAAVVAALVAGLSTSTWLFLREREALRQEARLRAEAEDGAKLTRAFFLLREGNFKDADSLLKEIKTPPTRPSFDAISAFRTMGDKAGAEGRWQEAADHFSDLVQIDGLDLWSPVTLDYQACGVALVECGNLARYDRFRQAASDAYAHDMNGDAAGRILKTCLLLPVDRALLGRLQPLGDRSEGWLAQLDSKPYICWAAIPVSLWRYRTGDYGGAEEYARRGMAKQPVPAAEADATLRLILAMCAAHTGNLVEARNQLSLARKVIEARFHPGPGTGDDGAGLWYDWVFARILLREAAAVVGK